MVQLVPKMDEVRDKVPGQSLSHRVQSQVLHRLELSAVNLAVIPGELNPVPWRMAAVKNVP